MAKIFLSVPVLDKPELKMLYSAYQAMLTSREHQVRIYFNENDSLISRVRNVHMTAFLDEFPECEYFVSIDSDIEIINTFVTNNIFNKLIAHDKDFVGGLYALKQDKTKPLCSSIPLGNISRQNIPFDSGLIEMRWLSSGCWCIKRSVLEKMVKEYPELTYVGDDNMAGKPVYGLCIPQIFEFEDDGKKYKKYLSEDWSFSERWRKIGGKIFADTSIALKHIGKTSYQLWNFEISKEPIPLAPAKQIENQQNIPDLPPAGFDLA
jgi:predicted DNA-binding protein YlxM (UPF0122 family)